MEEKIFKKINIKVVISMQQYTPVTTKFQLIWITSDLQIKLNPYSIMNVKLAAQVLSSTVSKTLTSYGPPEAAGTATFCLLMDSFFDIMNIRNIQSHEFERKPFLAPFTSVSDDWFGWLQNFFLKHFEDWLTSI